MEEIGIVPNDGPKRKGGNKAIIIASAVVIIGLIVLLCCIPFGGGSQWLTYENYLKIQTGMTYNQVVDVLDNHQGELDSTSSYEGYTYSIYSWTSGSKCIVVSFDNGKVSAKSQFGLN